MRAACEGLRPPQLFILNDQGNDPRAAELVARADGEIVVPGGNHDLVEQVDGVQPLHIHAEQAVDLSPELDLALFDFAFGHVRVPAERGEPRGGVIFMHHAGRHFPDIQMLLAHGEQHRDVLLGHDMSLAELRALELPRYDAGQIVAQHVADGIFGGD